VEVSVGLMRSRFETYPPQQFDLTVLEEDVLDSPITLGNHMVASGPWRRGLSWVGIGSSGWRAWGTSRRRRGWWPRHRRLPRLGSTPL